MFFMKANIIQLIFIIIIFANISEAFGDVVHVRCFISAPVGIDDQFSTNEGMGVVPEGMGVVDEGMWVVAEGLRVVDEGGSNQVVVGYVSDFFIRSIADFRKGKNDTHF